MAKTRVKTENVTTPAEVEWIPFSEERLELLRKRQRSACICTAPPRRWCLTCQANHLVLESAKVRDAFVEYGVTRMVADWTDGDETITKFIRSLGRNGVPVYALYGKDPKAPPEILPELLTQEIAIDALKKVHEEK